MSKILIVDDEAIITMQLEERLSTMGYEVAGMAACGEESIGKARRLGPDLILMDIVMPGKINGIEAARIITTELNIPVVFITAYADDAIIAKAKSVRPYGYIVKPFNELEIKAAIEVALFRRAAEQEEQRSIQPIHRKISSSPGAGQIDGDDLTYLDQPEIKTVLLEDIFTDIMLFLYTDQAEKDPIFKFALEEGIKKGGRNLFAYSHSTLQKYFPKEIQKHELYIHRIKTHELYTLLSILEKCTDSLLYEGTKDTLQILIDFSETEEFDEIIAIKNLLLDKKKSGTLISGMIALNIGKIDHTLIKILAEGISRIIVSTGNETTLSFAHHTYPIDSLSVVPQSTIDDVVKKLLEPVVLSLLDKPVSGYDIVHEIHNRYQVLIPQARVYTLLHDLLYNGYLEIRISGKSKLYCPTEKGRIHISQKLNDFKKVFGHILGGGNELPTENTDTRI
ncbi:MAG: response regulator [Methanospirillum sp.]|uniref:response regulator n=1 Tax=Methanospirillum sp. TaxID=45200 RepID=UPI002370C83B|nr:response regulator [Methanospirillum sp.]MDD1729698.1 response regulator [Methanospirillum sp.]